jgi:TolB protein
MKKLSAFLLILCVSINLFAIEKIDITRGNVEPVPLANLEFSGGDPMAREIGREMLEVVNNDLSGTGLFRIIDKDAYIESINNVRQAPKFSAWRQINAAALLVTEVHSIDKHKIKVEYQLWDPYTESSLRGHVYQAGASDWRRIAHKIADDIYKRITGDEGYFDTKIIFIAASGPFKHRIKRLAIIDQDGANFKYLSDGKYLTLTPRFSPDNKKLLYLSYSNDKPRVHLRDLNSGRDKILGHFKGMTFAPRFAPNGKEVAMSAASRGSSDVYVMDLAAKKSKQLTSGAYINTSPYFSPDNEKIAFISDRSGSSQIYIMDKDGSDQKRISFAQGRYYTPTWSPRGDFIAFTKSFQGTFYIGVMRPDGSGERILTQGYLVESPAWSPNGRVIMYARGDKYRGDGKATKSTLCTVDITGNFERTLGLPTDASDPTWSNILD